MHRVRAIKTERDAVGRAIDYCMRLLSRRQYSRGELEEKLNQRGYGEQTINRAISRLSELGLIDDFGLAERIIQSAIERRNRGRYWLIAYMRKLRLSEDCIRSAIEKFDLETETKIAAELIERWLSNSVQDMVYPCKDGDEKSDMARHLMLRLARRGFSAKAIIWALKRIGCKPFDEGELSELADKTPLREIDEDS